MCLSLNRTRKSSLSYVLQLSVLFAKKQQCVVTVMSEMEKLYHFTAAVAHLAVFDLSLAAYRR